MCEAPMSKWEQKKTPGLYKETLSIKLGCMCGVDQEEVEGENGYIVCIYEILKGLIKIYFK